MLRARDGGAETGDPGAGAEVDDGSRRVRIDRAAEQHRLQPGAVAGPRLHASTRPPRKPSTVKRDVSFDVVLMSWFAVLGFGLTSSAPMPASSRSLRAVAISSSATSTRRGRMPSEPSITLIFWSTTRALMPASRNSASTNEISTMLLVRRISSMPRRVSATVPATLRAPPESAQSRRVSPLPPSLVPPLPHLYGRSAGRIAKGAGFLGVVVPLEESKRKAGASIQPLVKLTRRAMERVNELILQRAGSEVG